MEQHNNKEGIDELMELQGSGLDDRTGDSGNVSG